MSLDVMTRMQPTSSNNPATFKFAKTGQGLVEEIRGNMEKASTSMKKYALKGKKPHGKGGLLACKGSTQYMGQLAWKTCDKA